MIYNIPYNYVLIDPNPDNLDWNGIRLDETVANTSIFGRVLAVPKNLRFRKRRGSRSERERNFFSRRNAASLDFGSKMEVSVGDTVVFYHHVKGETVFGGLLLIEYDKLLAKVGEDVVPLNGNVFIEVEMVNFGEKGTVTDGEGVVRFVSKHRNTGYMWSDRKDRFDPIIGHKVYYNAKQGYPLEHIMHESLGRLVAVKRKDIWLTY